MANSLKLHNDITLSARTEKAITSAVSNAEKTGKGWGEATDSLWGDGVRAAHLEIAKNGGSEKLRERVKVLVRNGLDKVYRDAMSLPTEAMPPKDSTTPADVKLRADRKEGQNREGRYVSHIRAMLHKREFPPVKTPKQTRTLEVRLVAEWQDQIDAIRKADAPTFDVDKVIANLKACCNLVA